MRERRDDCPPEIVSKMLVSIVDKLEIGDRTETPDGYLAVNAKIARMGHYQYLRGEIGDTEGNPNELVDVYRPEDEVFDADAMASFAHKPITLNHPKDAVSKDNWKQYSRGMSGGRVVRAGDFLEIPMVVNDGEAISAINNGTRELSAGYSAEITVGDGIAPDGKPYRALMSNIRGNHIAIVKNGRAGSQCRIGDAAWPVEDTTPITPQKKAPNMSKIVYDGLSVDLSDVDATKALIAKLEDAAKSAKSEADAKAKALTDAEVAHASALKDAIAAKDKAEAEVASLTKALADSKTTPEQLRDAAKAYSALVDAAGKIAPAFKIEDSMTDADIRKGVVLTVFGDTYKDKSGTFFDALFEVESAKIVDGTVTDAKPDAFRDAMANRTVVDFADAATKAAKARADMIAGFNAPRDAAK